MQTRQWQDGLKWLQWAAIRCGGVLAMLVIPTAFLIYTQQAHPEDNALAMFFWGTACGLLVMTITEAAYRHHRRAVRRQKIIRAARIANREDVLDPDIRPLLHANVPSPADVLAIATDTRLTEAVRLEKIGTLLGVKNPRVRPYASWSFSSRPF